MKKSKYFYDINLENLGVDLFINDLFSMSIPLSLFVSHFYSPDNLNIYSEKLNLFISLDFSFLELYKNLNDLSIYISK